MYVQVVGAQLVAGRDLLAEDLGAPLLEIRSEADLKHDIADWG